MKATLVEKIIPDRMEEIADFSLLEYGERHPLDTTVIIGRHPSCTIVIPLLFTRISREHLRIEKIGGHHYVIDLGSKFGTRVGENNNLGMEVLTANTPRILKPDEFIVLAFNPVYGKVFQYKEGLK